MFGDEGGLIEYRSSLLATHGFAALSLPYFNFEDLPKTMEDFHLEYFEEAARFLLRHPKVSMVRIVYLYIQLLALLQVKESVWTTVLRKKRHFIP